LRFGESIEQRRLADVRQAYDPAAETHLILASVEKACALAAARSKGQRGAAFGASHPAQTESAPPWGGALRSRTRSSRVRFLGYQCGQETASFRTAIDNRPPAARQRIVDIVPE